MYSFQQSISIRNNLKLKKKPTTNVPFENENDMKIKVKRDQ